MGESKNLRKKIQGELDVIQVHLEKIAAELKEPYPSRRNIAKWEGANARHLRILAKLEAKLPAQKREGNYEPNG